MGRLLIAIALMGGALRAQSLRVYSEFQRIDPFGQVVPMDRGQRSREILSPAVARNAWASFHVTVSAPPGVPYALYIGLNPEEAVRVTLYKERYQKYGEGWIPHLLEKVALPYEGSLPDAFGGVPKQTTQSFWLDIWVPGETPVDRMKVEPELNVRNGWITYPMEVRIVSPVLPERGLLAAPLPAVGAPADAYASMAWTGGQRSQRTAKVPTIGGFIYRNAAQDKALAQKRGEAAKLAKQNADRLDDRSQGAERYLRIRDYLLREAR